MKFGFSIIILGFLLLSLSLVSAEPQVFKCADTTYFDDSVEPGRISDGGEALIERSNHYMFEGEQIKWDVLVVDLNGIDNIAKIDTGNEDHPNIHEKVYVTVGQNQGEGNPIEVICLRAGFQDIFESCNARIEEEHFVWDPNIMDFFDCTFTVEAPETGMYGEYWVTVEAEDIDGNKAIMDENEFWYFNPIVSLTIDGNINFDRLTPGKTAYSNEILVRNSVDEGSGVMLDMFISGADFYSSQDFAFCPEKQKLGLDNFRYYAENGVYSTLNDLEVGQERNKDNEGYVNLAYGVGFNDPNPFYDGFEIVQQEHNSHYYLGNIIGPDQEMKVKFKLNVPEQCKGDFNDGSIFFWGEAI